MRDMKFLRLVCFAGALCCLLVNLLAVVPLPDEGGEQKGLGHEPFPTRMHAFIWRNWTVVPQTRLAEVLETKPAKVAEIATSMGLSSQGKILPEWQTNRGYITVIRRNWHLLPYNQLLTLLGMTREQLRFSLEEDDFLFIKLGRYKPACAQLLYQTPSESENAAAHKLASWLQEEGVSDLIKQSHEPRFSFVERLTHPDPNLVIPKSNGDSSFTLRFIFSYFADFCDPLIDPEISSYPEGLLQQLAAKGVNGVWLHTVLRTMAKDPAFPEFGENCETRIKSLRKLVERGAKYGVKIYLYINEPRSMPDTFFESRPELAEMRGAPALPGYSCLCTSHPEVRRWMSDALASIFQQVPGLGGAFTITASENHTNCASRNRWKECPRCKKRSGDAEIIADANTIIQQGVHRGNPDADVIFWDWGWRGHGDATEFFPLLPKNSWFMSVSEWAQPFTRGGISSKIGEYSISVVGPGPRATKHWQLAKQAGLRTVAKVQVAATWEFCAIPYLPTMDLVAEHALNLTHQDVDGVMLSWSLGSYPSPNLEVFQTFTSSTKDTESVLNQIAERYYGRKSVSLARQAWTAFSNGFKEFPYSNIYHGPYLIGPSNPLYLKPTGLRSTAVCYSFDALNSWRGFFPADIWISQMDKVRDGFKRGCDLWEELVRQSVGTPYAQLTREELGLFRTAEMHFASCVNQGRFIQARDQKPGDDKEAQTARLSVMRDAALAELEVTKQMLPLVMADSRIGYESSNHYFYIPQDLFEKVLCCRYILSELAND